MYRELTAGQSREFVDSSQTFEAWQSAASQRAQFVGGMHWKSVSGGEYLYRTSGGKGRAKSLGPRSPQTEKIYENFQQGKAQAEERFKSLADALQERARYCKAARINRVPRMITAILRRLEELGLLDAALCVVGTNALYAYEAAAAVQFDSSLLATADMDLLWDARSKLALAGHPDVREKGLMEILRQIDPSFAPIVRGGFRAANKDGYLVDLIKPTPTPRWQSQRTTMAQADELVAAEIDNLQWLQSSSRFRHVVIGDDGVPATMVTVDPRAFSVYKLWLSSQPRRETVKRNRDQLQAAAVAKLVHERLPQLPFDAEHLQSFPKEVVDAFWSAEVLPLPGRGRPLQ